MARLTEQDEDHVESEILYQSPTVWAGVKATRDPELRRACFLAYNDWIAEFHVDLDASRAAHAAVLSLVSLAPIE